MNEVSATLCATLLLVLNMVCLGTLIVLRRQRNTWFTFQALLVVVFWTSVPVSGVAHMMNEDRDLGFYTLLGSLTGNQDFVRALIAAVVGTIAVCGTAIWTPVLRQVDGPEEGRQTLPQYQTNRYSLFLIAFGFLLLFPSLFSIYKITSYAEATGLTRVTLIEGGSAKYAFMSHWFAWAVTLIAVGLINMPLVRGAWSRAVISLVAIGTIAWSLSWSGGRSVLVIMTLPLIVVAAGALKRRTWIFAIPIGFVLAFISARATTSRSEGYVNDSAFSTVSLLDWQWGRFSMLGFSSRVVEEDGYRFGETFYAGVRTIPEAIAKLFLGGSDETSSQLSTAITGEKILGDPNQRYIVPGLPAELYMNFGIIGVFVGLVALCYLLTRTEAKFVSSTNAADRIFWSYLCVVLIFCTIPAHSAAIFNYLIFSGAPVLVLPIISRLYVRWASLDMELVSPMSDTDSASAKAGADLQEVPC